MNAPDMNAPDMNAIDSIDKDEQPVAEKKTWSRPQVRDQSILSLTESKPNSNTTEASPSTGS